VSSDLDIIDPSLLPPLLRQLVGLLGVAETLRLLEARGGLPLYIPTHPDQTALRDVIAPSALAALCASPLAGDTVDLPKSDKLLAQLRNHYLLEAVGSGAKSARAVAHELGITWRRVKQIRQAARDRSPDPTGDLFA